MIFPGILPMPLFDLPSDRPSLLFSASLDDLLLSPHMKSAYVLNWVLLSIDLNFSIVKLSSSIMHKWKLMYLHLCSHIASLIICFALKFGLGTRLCRRMGGGGPSQTEMGLGGGGPRPHRNGLCVVINMATWTAVFGSSGRISRLVRPPRKKFSYEVKSLPDPTMPGCLIKTKTT